MYIAVCYDITDNRVRYRIVKFLESFGFRIQKSIFEIKCNHKQYKDLKKWLEKILWWKKQLWDDVQQDHDNIKIYILSKIWEWSIEWRMESLWAGYQKINFPDVVIL